jgi:hypothetical protein
MTECETGLSVLLQVFKERVPIANITQRLAQFLQEKREEIYHRGTKNTEKLGNEKHDMAQKELLTILFSTSGATPDLYKVNKNLAKHKRTDL